MKKSRLFTAGVLALTLALGLVLAGCDTGNTVKNTESSSSGGNTGGNTGGTVTKPSTPTGVTASRNPRSSEYVTISWNAVSGATSYNLYWSTSANGNYTKVSSRNATAVERYYHNADTSYWKVSAVNAGGESALSSYGTALGWQQ